MCISGICKWLTCQDGLILGSSRQFQTYKRGASKCIACMQVVKSNSKIINSLLLLRLSLNPWYTLMSPLRQNPFFGQSLYVNLDDVILVWKAIRNCPRSYKANINIFSTSTTSHQNVQQAINNSTFTVKGEKNGQRNLLCIEIVLGERIIHPFHLTLPESKTFLNKVK